MIRVRRRLARDQRAACGRAAMGHACCCRRSLLARAGDHRRRGTSQTRSRTDGFGGNTTNYAELSEQEAAEVVDAGARHLREHLLVARRVVAVREVESFVEHADEYLRDDVQ